MRIYIYREREREEEKERERKRERERRIICRHFFLPPNCILYIQLQLAFSIYSIPFSMGASLVESKLSKV